MRRLISAIAVGLLSVCAIALGMTSHNTDHVRANSPWSSGFFPNVPVVSHDGRKLKFYDDLIKGKLVVVNFIYTSCSNICPLVTSRMKMVKDALGDRVGKDIFFLSITIDPIFDGPEVLRKYAETFHSGDGWTFVTGEPDDMATIREKLGERSGVKADHRNDIMIGNDSTGSWGRDSGFSDVEVLADTILAFDPAWQKPRPVAPVAVENTPYKLSDNPGSYLFVKACGGCHSIGHGDIVGPDLAGVLTRRDHTWLRRFLREPDRMRREKDALAVELDERYPGVRMPDLNLSNTDVDDLFAYLASETAKLYQSKRSTE